MQRYRCGDCGRCYQPGGAYHRGPAVKERALRLYLESGSLSAIGRVLGYSAQAVSQWVKKRGGRPWPWSAGAGIAIAFENACPIIPGAGWW